MAGKQTGGETRNEKGREDRAKKTMDKKRKIRGGQSPRTALLPHKGKDPRTAKGGRGGDEKNQQRAGGGSHGKAGKGP